VIDKKKDSSINYFILSRISKVTIKKKAANTEINCKKYLSSKQTIKENDFRISLSNLFHKSKQLKTPSPLLITFSDIPQDIYDNTIMNTSSSWSSSTNSDSTEYKKNSKHRSCIESYDLRKENIAQKNNIFPSKKLSNEIKSSAKSKLVLENVRKMIKDQNSQQQQQQQQ